jgi:hypothetical protein
VQRDIQEHIYEGLEHKDLTAFSVPVKNSHVVKFKIHNMYLLMVLPKVIAQPVNIMAPSPPHHQQIFPIQILYQKLIFCGKTMMDGDRTAQWLPGKLQSRAVP